MYTVLEKLHLSVLPLLFNGVSHSLLKQNVHVCQSSIIHRILTVLCLELSVVKGWGQGGERSTDALVLN